MSEFGLSPQVRHHRRQRILGAALKLFAARPYAEVLMDDVARAAGVAKPTLYRYFGTKESLFLEALEELLGDLGRRLDQAAADAAGPAEALASALAIALEGFSRYAAALLAVGGPESSLGERGRAVIRAQGRRLRGYFAQIVEQGVARGTFAAVEPQIAASMILGAIRMTAAHSSASGQAEALRVLTQVFGQGLARPLGAGAARRTEVIG